MQMPALLQSLWPLEKKQQFFNIAGFISITVAKNEQLISFISSSSVAKIREWNQLLWQ